jgi:hypothetical protein
VGNKDHRSPTLDEHFVRESVKSTQVALFFCLSRLFEGREFLDVAIETCSAEFQFSDRIPRQPQLPARLMPCQEALPIANGACHAQKGTHRVSNLKT